MTNNGNGNGHGSHSWWASLWKRSGRSDKHLEACRRIAIQLHYDLPHSNSARSVMIVSPLPSSQSAIGSVNLASSLAEEIHKDVLLIDACPKGPQISELFKCTTLKGFADWLSDPNLPLEEMVLPTSHAKVWFLPAGTNRSQSPSSDALKALLKVASERYDFVVLSGGPVLNNSIALALAPRVGCVLLMAVENETMIEDLDAAQDALGYCKARKVGLLYTTPAGR